MFKVHGFLDNKQVINWRMEDIPQVGDTMRFNGERYGKVTEVVWCMDEESREGQRVNIRIESEEKKISKRVVCAANKNGDLLVLGARHFDMTMNRTIELIDPDGRLLHEDWEQGFIDQHGEFLTREDAWVVAEAAGQIIRRVGGDGKRLYSENLY